MDFEVIPLTFFSIWAFMPAIGLFGGKVTFAWPILVSIVVTFPLRETTRIVIGTVCENAIGVGIIGELLLDDTDIVYETLLPTGGL